MLVPAMNNQEMYREVAKDDKKLRETTVKRLIGEYDRERKKLKIKKESNYFKTYHIKSGNKNNWLLFFHKCHLEKKYGGTDSVRYLNVTYYYDHAGLKVVSIGDDNMLTIYTGHLFKRYNERLGLNLSQPLDIVKAFFENCGYLHADVTEKKNRFELFGVVKDGLLFGNYYRDPVTLEWKTFISRDLKRPKQDVQEKVLIEDLQMEVIKERQKPSYNPYSVERTKSVYKAITGRYAV